MPTKVDRTGMLVGMRGRMRLALFILSEPLRGIRLGYAKRCILSAIIGLPMLWCGVCQGVGFMVEGRLEYYPPQNAPMKDYLFEGAISEEKWILKIYEGGKRRQRGHWEHGFEGTNEFTLYYVNQEPYEVAVKKTNFAFINGVVKPRTSPAISQFTPVHVFWFAFRCAVYTNEQYSRVPRNMIYGSCVETWPMYAPTRTHRASLLSECERKVYWKYGALLWQQMLSLNGVAVRRQGERIVLILLLKD